MANENFSNIDRSKIIASVEGLPIELRKVVRIQPAAELSQVKHHMRELQTAQELESLRQEVDEKFSALQEKIKVLPPARPAQRMASNFDFGQVEDMPVNQVETKIKPKTQLNNLRIVPIGAAVIIIVGGFLAYFFLPKGAEQTNSITYNPPQLNSGEVLGSNIKSILVRNMGGIIRKGDAIVLVGIETNRAGAPVVQIKKAASGEGPVLGAADKIYKAGEVGTFVLKTPSTRP